jgi:hypothetical protein
MYQIVVTHSDGSKEVLELFEKEHEADYVCNELNIAATDFSDGESYSVVFKGE